MQLGAAAPPREKKAGRAAPTRGTSGSREAPSRRYQSSWEHTQAGGFSDQSGGFSETSDTTDGEAAEPLPSESSMFTVQAGRTVLKTLHPFVRRGWTATATAGANFVIHWSAFGLDGEAGAFKL